jgi:Arc/MetJ-type ribon-helix-helix transcriptional regulator
MGAKTISFSLPEDMAREINELAERERRSVSEVMREAWRTYRVDQFARLAARTASYAEQHNPMGYTEADVPKLIREVRSQLHTRKK